VFSDLTKENNAFEISAASPYGIVKNKSKPADDAIMKKFEKDNKILRGHLLNHMINPCSICLPHLNLPKSYRRD